MRARIERPDSTPNPPRAGMRHGAEAETGLLTESPVIVSSPTRNVRAHQRLEHATMIANPEMKELMHDDEILKALRRRPRADR